MILIKNTKKEDIAFRLESEANFVAGMRDTLQLLTKIDVNQKKQMEDYIHTNAVLKGIDANFRRLIHQRVGILEAIVDATSKLETWIPKLQERLKKSATKTFDTETITFRERGILDAISAINFFNRYSSMIVEILLEQANKPVDLNRMLNKIDLAFFNDTAKHFVTVTVRFTKSVNDLDAMLNALSEEVADEVSESILREAEGDASVSIRSGMAPHHLNPVHWMKLWRMRRDVKLIEVNQKRIEMLAMKIARLNNQRNGQQDPALDHTIGVYEDKIIKLDSEIRDTVEKYRE